MNSPAHHLRLKSMMVAVFNTPVITLVSAIVLNLLLSRFVLKTVANCNCNNPQSAQSDSIKLSRSDPTLASGDIVIEDTGAFVYDGTAFVPLARAKGVSSQMRQRILSMLKGNGEKSGRQTDSDPASQPAPSPHN